MKKNHTFCKNDGQIKQYYIPICEYIVKAERIEHEIMIGRSDDVVEKYTCFTTPRIVLNAKDRRSYMLQKYEMFVLVLILQQENGI